MRRRWWRRWPSAASLAPVSMSTKRSRRCIRACCRWTTWYCCRTWAARPRRHARPWACAWRKTSRLSSAAGHCAIPWSEAMRRDPALEQWITGFLQREQLPAAYRDTISGVLLPLAEALATRVRQSDSLVVIGLCGAQGSGKSTAAAVLCELLGRQELPALAVSIDDFYLPHAERQELAHRVHPLLATRGVPGTHDVELAQAVIESLADAGETAVPAFDKATDDRRPRPEWRRVSGPLRAVILEGWCVGARPQTAAELAPPLNALERDEDARGIWRSHVNAALQGPYAALFARLSPVVLLAAPSFEVVLGWRREQEHKLRDRLQREGGDASRLMSDAAIARFISHYERITRHILAEMPARADHLIDLDVSRHAQWRH